MSTNLEFNLPLPKLQETGKRSLHLSQTPNMQQTLFKHLSKNGELFINEQLVSMFSNAALITS